MIVLPSIQKIIFYVFVSLLFSYSITAQNNKALIDSLEKLTLTQKDTDLIKTYNELTWQYRTLSPEKAIDYGNKALALGIKTGFNKGIAQAYNDLGILYYDKQDNTKALELYHQSLIIRLKMGDKNCCLVSNILRAVY